jgi:hypothetical protein
MSTSADMIAKPRNDRGILSVRILTWVAVALFLPAFLLAPQGTTVFWSGYFMLFGPVIAVDLAAMIGFIVCRLRRRKISFAYLLISLAVLAAVRYVTWFQLRLRWYEVF